MKLYIGGAFQGQEELARLENPNSEIISAFHELMREKTREGADAREFAREFVSSHPDAVVVSDEIGSGIVPMNAFERAWRESTGRALCVIASSAETVTRVVCGIGRRIK